MYSIQLMNSLGKVVHQQQMKIEEGRTVQMNLIDLPSGIYHLVIRGEQSKEVLQIAKMQD